MENFLNEQHIMIFYMLIKNHQATQVNKKQRRRSNKRQSIDIVEAAYDDQKATGVSDDGFTMTIKHLVVADHDAGICHSVVLVEKKLSNSHSLARSFTA